jgi:hypothetical protein
LARVKKQKPNPFEVNPNSPKQVSKLLYETLGMPEQLILDKKTKKKKITTGKEAIKKLKKYDSKGVVAALEEYRKANKEMATYGDKLLDPDGRMHTKYSQTVTDTGRLSSRQTDDDTGTDQQNLPPAFRKIVIPDKDMVLVEGDLRQAEARIFFWQAQVKELIEVCRRPDANIHKYTASQLFKIPEEEVVEDSSADQPYGKCKRITHGTHYGLGVNHGAELAGCSVAEFKKFRAMYFNRFPEIPAHHQRIREIVLPVIDKNGKIVKWPTGERLMTTPLGRQRMFLGRPNEDLVRKMIAFVPQSTCVDYLNAGLVRLFGCEEMDIKGLIHEHYEDFVVYDEQDPIGGAVLPELLIQTHDGFLAQCLFLHVNRFCQLAKEAICLPIMLNNRELVIPLKLQTGMNWGELN